MRYSWLDLALYFMAVVFLIPLVVHFIDAVMKAAK